MKATVYIRDGLWELVKAKVQMEKPDITKTSQILHEALMQFTADTTHDRPAYSRIPPPNAGELIADLRARFSQEAREQFEQGFHDGLELAKKGSWQDIQDLHQIGWSFHEWLRTTEQNGRIARTREQYVDEDLDALYTVLGEYVIPDETDAFARAIYLAHGRREIYQTGFVDALRHIWQSVTGIRAPEGPWPDRE